MREGGLKNATVQDKITSSIEHSLEMYKRILELENELKEVENLKGLKMSENKEQNLIKKTCKELNLTQKELASKMGLAENTVSQWARGVTNTPLWACRMFELLKIERQFNLMKEFFNENVK